MDLQDGDPAAVTWPEEWGVNKVTTASGDCVVTVTVRSPVELDRDAVQAALSDAVAGMEALLGWTR